MPKMVVVFDGTKTIEGKDGMPILLEGRMAVVYLPCDTEKHPHNSGTHIPASLDAEETNVAPRSYRRNTSQRSLLHN